MDQWLKTGSLMSKFETSENTDDNEGNSEKPEIVYSCDSYGVVPKFSHTKLIVERMIAISCQMSSKSTESCHILFSHDNLRYFLSILEI